MKTCLLSLFALLAGVTAAPACNYAPIIYQPAYQPLVQSYVQPLAYTQVAAVQVQALAVAQPVCYPQQIVSQPIVQPPYATTLPIYSPPLASTLPISYPGMPALYGGSLGLGYGGGYRQSLGLGYGGFNRSALGLNSNVSVRAPFARVNVGGAPLVRENVRQNITVRENIRVRENVRVGGGGGLLGGGGGGLLGGRR